MRSLTLSLLLPLAVACSTSSESLVGSQLDDDPASGRSGSSSSSSSGGAMPNQPAVCRSVQGTVNGTGSSGLRVRAEPNTDSAERGRVDEGSTVTIYCQTEGENIQGSSVWSYLGADRGYVAGAYVDTGSEGFDPDVPRCDAASLACGAAAPPPDPTDPGTDTAPDPIGSSPAVDVEGPAIRAHVQAFANDACAVLGACTISTYAGHSPSADLALDFLTSDEYGEHPTDDYAFGDRLAAYAVKYMAEYRIEYVIYRQRIHMGEDWDAMSDRGGVTENHYDHVHVTFEP